MRRVGVSLVVIKGELKASSIVSSRGLAACGQIKGTIPKTGLSGSVELGYQKEWGKDSELGGCEIDKYIPASLKGGAAMVTGFGTKAFDPLARAAQTPAGTLTLKAGTMAGVKVTGAGGRPGFTFAGPSGRTITVPANITEPVIEPTIAAIPVGPDSVELQVKNPKGSWTVAADGAAPAVAQVFSAGVLPTPKTTASVRRGSGNTRVVRVKTSNLGSQSLILRELLPDGAANEIGRITANGSKRFTFTPAIAAGGRRTIEAVIVNGAKVSGTKKVASLHRARSRSAAGTAPRHAGAQACGPERRHGSLGRRHRCRRLPRVRVRHRRPAGVLHDQAHRHEAGAAERHVRRQAHDPRAGTAEVRRSRDGEDRDEQGREAA